MSHLILHTEYVAPKLLVEKAILKNLEAERLARVPLKEGYCLIRT